MQLTDMLFAEINNKKTGFFLFIIIALYIIVLTTQNISP